MKKYILENKKALIAIAIILILFIILKIYEGTSSISVLTCSYNKSISIGTYDTTIKVYEKKNKMEVNSVNKIIYSETIDESNVQEIIDLYEEKLSTSDDMEYDLYFKDNTLYVTLDAVATADNEIDLTKSLNVDVYQSTIDEIKSDLEEGGFVCVKE